MTMDVLQFAQKLIQCPSVTPDEAGALDLLQEALEPLGFICNRLQFDEVDNLYARLGDTAPNFCFAGHVDVVPVGDAQAWSFDPFAAEVRDGNLCGRGASDMKGAVAAFVASIAEFLKDNPNPKGSISLLITCDEEGPSVNGTVKVLEHLEKKSEKIDLCLVGEPTNPNTLGEMMKIGRRGSMSATITVNGTQGHVAYPHLADNPLPQLVKVLSALDSLVLDTGSEHFQPSNLEIVTIDTGNEATNVIPANATARVNIRFNDLHTGASLSNLISKTIKEVGIKVDIDFMINGESFITKQGILSDTVAKVVEDVTGRKPDLSTTGGTSDARFISQYCPVIEFGGVGKTMHQVDENMAVADLKMLVEIYTAVLKEIL